MVRFKNSRASKAFISVMMTIVMVVSLFAGMGAIWATESTDIVSAASSAVIDKKGNYIIPPSKASAAKGSEDNPFVVLEIVPNANMAQFGYLVSGEEPIDLGKLANRIAAHPDDDVWKGYKTKLQQYLAIKADTGVASPATEFASLINDSGEYTYVKEAGTQELSAKKDQFVWEENVGSATQYGTYKKNASGDYALIENVSYDNVGYIVRKNTTGDAAPASVSVSEKLETDREFASLDDANAYMASLSGYNSADTLKSDDGLHVYIKSASEGEGLFSSMKFEEDEREKGTYSLRYKYVGSGGNYTYAIYTETSEGNIAKLESELRSLFDDSGDMYNLDFMSDSRFQVIYKGDKKYELQRIENNPAQEFDRAWRFYGKKGNVEIHRDNDYFYTKETYNSEVWYKKFYYIETPADTSSLGWQPVTSGSGEYADNSGRDFLVPQSLNDNHYGEYTLAKTYEIPIHGKDKSDQSVLYSKDYDCYDIIALENLIPHYSYKICSYNEVPRSSTIIGRYTWTGKSYKDSVQIEHDDTEKVKYNCSGLSGTYDAENRQFRTGDSFDAPDEIREKLLEQSYDQGYPGTYKSEDLFKKFAIGLGYKNNDYTKGEDVDSFKFLKWCTDPYGINELSDSAEIRRDTTLYAKWLISYPTDIASALGGDAWEGYTIEFHDNASGATVTNMPGDSVNHSITGISKNKKIVAPDAIPVREGYEFTGWYRSASATNKFDFNNQTVNDDNTDDNRVLHLYAGWKALGSLRFNFSFNKNLELLPLASNSYKIENYFESLNDVSINGYRYYTVGDTEIKHEAVINEPICNKTDDTPSGYVFAGWYQDVECNEPFEFSQDYLENIKAEYKKNHTDYNDGDPIQVQLYANWINTSSKPRYSVTFDANIPTEAVAKKAGGLQNQVIQYLTGEVNKTLTLKDGKANLYYGSTLPTGLRPTPTLAGNITEKINNYHVKVITATPRQFDESKNYGMIQRADFIVLNETCEEPIRNLWDECHKKTGLDKNKDGLADAYNFFRNDLGWASTMQILSRITGFYFGADNKRINVQRCPVLFDYNICLSAVFSGDTSITKNVSYTYKYADGSTGTNTQSGINTNVTKLYVLTQYASPVTLSNAYLSGNLDNKKIDGSSNTGKVVATPGSDYMFSSSNGGDVFWGADTLTPYNIIDKADWENPTKRSSIQQALGINGNIFDGSCRIKNRIFIFGNDGISSDAERNVAGNAWNMVTRFNSPLKLSVGQNDVNSMLKKGGDYNFNASDVFYYMIHSDTLYQNLERDMKILEIQPGTYKHSDEYWFWFISQYAPNISGSITSRSMSSVEFITNIEDLNSTYDAIYIGVDKTGMLDHTMPTKSGSSEPYRYAHTGKIEDLRTENWGGFNKVLDADTGRLSDDDATAKAAYSGNDLSFAKYKAVAEFVKAGYPVILSKDIFEHADAIDDYAIDTKKIDTASWIYKLIDELVDDYKKETPKYHCYRENNAEKNKTFVQALNNKCFKLEVLSKPKEYREGVSDRNKYINGSTSDTSLRYEIRINANTTGGRYKVKLYVDSNADGKFDEKTEMIDARVTDITDPERSTIIRSDGLKSGRTYRIQRDISDKIGAIPWKLEVVELNGSGNEKEIRDEATGLCAIKVAENKKADIYVLQITTDLGTWFNYWDNKYGGSTVIFATDEEVDRARNNNGGSEINTTNKNRYFDGVLRDYSRNGSWYNNEAKLEANAGSFYYYISKLQEYNVHFVRVDTDKLKEIAEKEWDYVNSVEDNKTQAEIDAAFSARVPVGKAYKTVNGVKELKDLFWNDLDMLILGYGDCYNDITSNDSLNLIKDFILEGKSVLFTHDTTSYVNYYDQTKFNTLTMANDYNNRSAQWYGININTYFRDFLGMDRYGLTLNRGYLDRTYSGGEELFKGSKAKSVSELANDALKGDNISSEDKKNLDFTEISDFDKINISNAYKYKLSYDIPFKTGSTIKIKDGGSFSNKNLSTARRRRVDGSIWNNGTARALDGNNNNSNWSNYIYYTLNRSTWKFEQNRGAYLYHTGRLNSTEEGGDTRILTQGLTNRNLGSGSNLTVKKARMNNSGQIIRYPYEIPEEIRVAETHVQYYQINPENEDIVVWYSLAADPTSTDPNDGKPGEKHEYYFGDKNSTYLDGVSNYYIFNNGNVTYTGVGHSLNLTDDEVKLFVNTFVASYRAHAKAPEIEINNKDKSVDGNKIFLYVDYDASIPEGTGAREGIELSAVPVGDEIIAKKFDGTIVEDPYATPGEVEYYSKRVFFTLSNTSLILNPVISVHYHLVDDTGVRYDLPSETMPGLSLSTYLSTEYGAETTPELAELLKDSEKPYRYVYQGKAKNIGVDNVVAKLKPNEEYYVDIPISDEYYEKFMHLDKFALNEKSTFTIQMDIVMRYGRNLKKQEPLVGSRQIVMMRRGLFKLD